MVDVFRLPKDGSIYADAVFSRCRNLISYGIWSGLSRSRLDKWIANFLTPEERYFAARVLDSLIYRSDDQTVALLRQLLDRVIPDHARLHALPQCLKKVGTQLRSVTFDPRVRIVPVIPPGSPPTKSGPVIARHLKRTLRVNERWVLYPADLAAHISNVDAVIFLDDFLGTGDQFSSFLSSTGLLDNMAGKCAVYGCLAGHQRGIDSLSSAFPTLNVAAVEVLDEKHAIFHPDAEMFPDGENSPEVARDFYYNLLKKRQIHLSGPDRRGYGHMEIAYAFEHAVPDNSLPILWWRHSELWQPLFDR